MIQAVSIVRALYSLGSTYKGLKWSAWWTSRWAFLGRHHRAHSSEGWILLAYSIPRIIHACAKMLYLSDVRREAEEGCTAFAARHYRQAIWAVGSWRSRRMNPHSSKGHRYVLTATDYFTRWLEAIPWTTVNDVTIMKFLEKQIITRFGMPFSRNHTQL